MKRKSKNIFMIITMLLFIGLMVFTVYKISNRNAHDDSHIMLEGNGYPQEINNDEKGEAVSPQLPSENSQPDGNVSGEMGENNGGTPPEKPNGSDQTPPEIPDGNNAGESANQAPPEIPSVNDGDAGSNQMPQNANGSNEGFNPMDGQKPDNSLKATDYVVYAVEGLAISIVAVLLIFTRFNKKTFKETISEKSTVLKMVLSIFVLTGLLLVSCKMITAGLNNKNINGFGGAMDNSSITYKGNMEIVRDDAITSGEYKSESSDENAILVSGNISVEMDDVKINKSGDSDGGDTTSFYGINSAILAKDGAVLTIKNADIETDATGANGVFSYGGSATTNNTSKDSTTINISDSVITTTKDNSGGIMTTGGGITNASNLTVTTSGISSAAIRTDRGGGIVNVDGGTYQTNGKGSPAIYSTANVTVKNAELKSLESEGIIIEGKNSITLENSSLSAANNQLNGLSTTYKNIFIYQSMSGDAATGVASLVAKNNDITTINGDTIYVTNTKANIYLNNNNFINYDEKGNFLRIQKDSWGNEGQNGGDVLLTMEQQTVSGNIVVDSLSTLSIKMSGSNYEGTINSNDTAKEITLSLDSSSKIKLTGDSFVSSFENEDSSNSNIDFNGYKLFVDGVAIN